MIPQVIVNGSNLTAFGNLLAFEGWSSIMGYDGLWTTTAGGDIYELTNFDMNSKSNQINDITVVNNGLFMEATNSILDRIRKLDRNTVIRSVEIEKKAMSQSLEEFSW